MKFRTLSIITLLLFGTTLAHGAVIVIYQGQNIQSAINEAASGDEIIIHQGTYSEDLVIEGKGFNIRSNHGDQVEIDSITFKSPEHPIKISNLRVMGDFNATKENLSIIGSKIWGNLNYSSSGESKREVNISNTLVQKNVNLNKVNLTVKNSTINGSLYCPDRSDDASNDLSTIILQSTIHQKLESRANKSWILYNKIRYAAIEGLAIITGNEFEGRGAKAIGLDIFGSNTYAKISNNEIQGYYTRSGSLNDVCIGVRIKDNAKADITNNIIFNCFDSDQQGTEIRSGLGIYVESTSGTTILGNAIWSCFIRYGTGSNPGDRLVWAPYSKVIFKNNFLWKTHADQNPIHHGGGVESVENISELSPSASVFSTIGNYSLASDSPLIDAGPPDPQYNDRDGSRNDIGMFGGHNFIPDGRTTNKPIVLGLDVAPIAVPTGGTVTIESTGATVK